MRNTLSFTLTLTLGLFSCACGDPQTDEAPVESARADDGAADQETAAAPADGSIHALTAETLDGESIGLDRYAGKVVVFVNVASKCGYTRQYEDLQALHAELGGDGFAVVGIPSNDFGGQEPGTADEIRAFCTDNYGVTFDMLAKTGTKEGDSPIFDSLARMTGERPTWNFCKYVVSPDGTSAKFFASSAKPGGDELRGAIDAMREG